MEPSTLTALAKAADLLATGGPTLALIALLYAIHAGYLVLRREYRALEVENERLRTELAAERGQADTLLAAATHALDAIASGAGRSAPNA